MRERFSEVMAEAYVARTCFKTGPPRALGVELEWILHDHADPTRRLTPADIAAAVAVGPALKSGRLTVEPGGQLELSSFPFTDPVAGLQSVATDVETLRVALIATGLDLAGVGIDPWRSPERLLDTPRYAAMERHFDRRGAAGRTMMCSTAAIQLNLDAGPDPGSDPERAVDMPTRWALLHELVPVLVGAFANSPLTAGQPNGLRCGRAEVWRAIDPARTRPAHSPDLDPRTAWADYVLSAPVLCLPNEGSNWDAPAGLTFRSWLRGDGPRPASSADLDYHLTTLFPPVRPRGHFELRVIDAQRTVADALAATALVWALCTDRAAAESARATLAALTPGAAARAARDAMADGELAAAAMGCFEAALDALDRLGAGALGPPLAAFAERYPGRGRCPADDTAAEWSARREATCLTPTGS